MGSSAAYRWPVSFFLLPPPPRPRGISSRALSLSRIFPCRLLLRLAIPSLLMECLRSPYLPPLPPTGHHSSEISVSPRFSSSADDDTIRAAHHSPSPSPRPLPPPLILSHAHLTPPRSSLCQPQLHPSVGVPPSNILIKLVNFLLFCLLTKLIIIFVKLVSNYVTSVASKCLLSQDMILSYFKGKG